MVKPDGDGWRRVVPSPLPQRIFEQRPIEWLLAQGCVVVCAGGGGIPTMYRPGTRTLVGVEAVIDKDRASAVLARDLDADALVIATDTDAVYVGLGHCRPAPDRGGAPGRAGRLGFPPGRWVRRSRPQPTSPEGPGWPR